MQADRMITKVSEGKKLRSKNQHPRTKAKSTLACLDSLPLGTTIVTNWREFVGIRWEVRNGMRLDFKGAKDWAFAFDSLRREGSRPMKTILHYFLRDESGSTIIEYGLVGALISIVIVGAVSLMGTILSGIYTAVGTALGAGWANRLGRGFSAKNAGRW
jgi:pilus assembly protein Flp/PilA